MLRTVLLSAPSFTVDLKCFGQWGDVQSVLNTSTLTHQPPTSAIKTQQTTIFMTNIVSSHKSSELTKDWTLKLTDCSHGEQD